MQQIVNFFLRNKNFLLYLFLLFLSLVFIVQSHSYHQSKFINSANFLTGGIFSGVNNIRQYFNLREENQQLLQENNRLKSLVFNDEDSLVIDTTLAKKYNIVPAKVYKNSYSSTNNYLTINKGKRDSIEEDLGVITSKGIIGIIDNTSKGYARVMTVLNSNSRINAQLKKSDHFGTLMWDGKSPQIVQLVDLPKQAPIMEGDTITTGGRSIIFPKGIPIGSVISLSLDETENYYLVNIQLFNDMTSIGHVHVIKNLDMKEIETVNNPDE